MTLVSPGPSWAVLTQPASSNVPSTRTSTHSDVDFDVDMGDDEGEHDRDSIQSPLSKRKASDTDSASTVIRKPHKLPRLEVNGVNGRSLNHVVPSRTQPAPPSLSTTGLKKSGSLSQGAAVRVQPRSVGSSKSTSDFPNTISQRVQQVVTRDKEREREKERTRERERERGRAPPLSSSSRSTTARKQTSNPKNVRKVCTATLLKTAQNSSASDSRDESLAWTHTRPKLKQKRTSFDQEMGSARPMAVARQRGDDSTIELTDSSASARRRRQSQPSVSLNGARSTTLVNKDDPIIITSGSEEEPRLMQWRNGVPSGTQGRGAANRPRAPPPADAEVISLTDSEDDVFARPSTSGGNRSSQVVVPPAPATVPPGRQRPDRPWFMTTPIRKPTVPLTYVPTHLRASKTPPSEQPPPPQNTKLPGRQMLPPSYDSPPSDDIDDPFNNVDFDTNANMSGDLDGFGAETLLRVSPVGGPSGDVDAGEPAVEEDASSSDAIFESYLNMDQLRGDEDALPGRGGDGEEGRIIEPGGNVDANGTGGSAHDRGDDEGSTSDGPKVNRDMRMQTLEEGEVDPNDAWPATPMSPETPESGEVRSQGLSGAGEALMVSESVDVRMRHSEDGEVELDPNGALAPATPESGEIRSRGSGGDAMPPRLPVQGFAVRQHSSATSSPSLVMPDISSYKGVRFKRSLPESRENAFFSRALAGAGRSRKMPVEKNVSTHASSVGEVQNQDVDMQDDAVVSPPPQSLPQPMTVPDVRSTHVIPLTADDRLPSSTQPAPSSVRATPSEPFSASQPLSRSSSRPFIAPPRVSRPGTPMSLVDALNEVRRERLLNEERRKRGVSDPVAEPLVAPRKSAGQGPPPTLTRAFGKTPSLKDIRTLLASRNVSSSSGRPTPTSMPTPTQMSNEDRKSEAPTEVPVSVTMTASADGSNRGPGTSHRGACATPILKTRTRTISESSARQRRISFEAFISPSPAQLFSTGIDKGTSGLNGSPIASRTCAMSTRLRGKRRDGRRESTFDEFIVRDSPRGEQTRVVERMDVGADDEMVGADVDAGTNKDRDAESLVQNSSGGEESARVEPVVDSVEAFDEGTEPLDAPKTVDSTHAGNGESSGETDEADVLLELASVHLSQPNAGEENGVPEVAVEETKIMGELPDESAPTEAGNAMVVDGPLDESTDPQTAVEDVPKETVENVPAPPPVPLVEDNAMSMDADAERFTTPDLILPEDPEPLPFFDGHAHERRQLGGDDSMDECDALLRVQIESEPTSSVKTVSSTSLVPPQVRPRSKERSPSLGRDQGRIMTWASNVAEERERRPEYKLAKNLPHSLQDYMNILPESIRNSDVGREIFEAHIQEAMIGEPDAPPIEIFDNGIGNEVTPRWEFHYTNELWYADDVPPPDIKNLESCGCVGRCDPKSSTCVCAQRQRRWVQRYIDGEIIPPTWPGSPFVYDHKGQLQRFECPIFECNRFCSCDEDCPNRVVQNGRRWPVHIARTAHKGWGVTAGNKKIPKGSYIGVYAGELLTEQEGDARGRYYDLYGRTYLFSVDFHHLKMDMEDPDEFENLYVVDAYHAGNLTRFLNHSCDPNCKILACYIDDAGVDKPLMAVFTTRDIDPWEELSFSYYGDIEEKREEISQAGDLNVREHAVYAQCRCGADNCIGRLFS